MALAAAALALGAVFVAFGIVLLIGLAAVGAIAGVGVMLFRSLTGRRGGRLRAGHAKPDLDPSLEVFPLGAAQPPHPIPAPSKRAGSEVHEPE
jgi:hypothetical protein